MYNKPEITITMGAMSGPSHALPLLALDGATTTTTVAIREGSFSARVLFVLVLGVKSISVGMP